MWMGKWPRKKLKEICMVSIELKRKKELCMVSPEFDGARKGIDKERRFRIINEQERQKLQL